MLDEPSDAVRVVRAVPDLTRVAARAGPGSVTLGERRRGRRRRPRNALRGGERERRARRPRATTTAPAPAARAAASHSGSPRTTVQPGRTTASFSAAIASRVSPSTSVCSSETFVSTTTRVASSTFVASWRPPSPASTTAASTPRLAERDERRRGEHLELGRAEPLGRGPNAQRARPRDRPRRRRRGSAPPRSGRAARGTRRP